MQPINIFHILFSCTHLFLLRLFPKVNAFTPMALLPLAYLQFSNLYLQTHISTASISPLPEFSTGTSKSAYPNLDLASSFSNLVLLLCFSTQYVLVPPALRVIFGHSIFTIHYKSITNFVIILSRYSEKHLFLHFYHHHLLSKLLQQPSFKKGKSVYIIVNAYIMAVH